MPSWGSARRPGEGCTSVDGAGLEADLAAAVRGDAAAFGRLATWLERDCWRLALTFTGDEDLAGDMWQDALLAAWERLPRFRGELSGFRGWMMTIVANRCRNQLSYDRRHRPVMPTAGSAGTGRTEQPTEPLHLILDPSAPLEQLLEDRAWEDLLRTTLAAVPEPHQTALRYHCLDYGYAEIAELIGSGTNTVGTRIYRGRQAARRFLARSDRGLAGGGRGRPRASGSERESEGLGDDG